MIGGSNRLLSTREAAEMLGISRQTLYNNWRSWGLKSVKVGGALKFRVRDIEAWLEANAAA
jgi:excisionase family DNA binding protein